MKHNVKSLNIFLIVLCIAMGSQTVRWQGWSK